MLKKEHLTPFITASKDKTRPLLTSVRFTAEVVDSQNIICIASTDGYRLTEKRVEIDFTPTWEELLIPASTVELVHKILKKHHRVLLTENQFQIMNIKDIPEGYLERTITIGNKIDGNYPEYKSLIPTDENVSSSIIDKKYLIEALKQVEGTTVLLEVRGGLSPVVLKDVNEDTTKTVSIVMPLKG